MPCANTGQVSPVSYIGYQVKPERIHNGSTTRSEWTHGKFEMGIYGPIHVVFEFVSGSQIKSNFHEEKKRGTVNPAQKKIICGFISR